jgi:hypothetical protein
MRTLMLLLLILGSLASAQNVVTKNGLQFKDDLIHRLDLSDTNSVEKLFLSLRQNLPKQSTMASLAGGMDSLAKLAVEACTQAGYFEDDWSDIDGLYFKLLDRHATAEEIKTAVRDDNKKLSFMPNCFQVAMSPEFLIRRNL